jgi:tRNA A58 N-methylase Trm61
VFAKEALKDGGKLVTFSPCIEQIQVAPLVFARAMHPLRPHACL